ncbi:MAG: c-type cytochrome [Gemmatimonadales bacterium]|nr:c-type cytochrome [Gemmatimonadales bacterium]
MRLSNSTVTCALVFILGVPIGACSGSARDTEGTAAAPVDSGAKPDAQQDTGSAADTLSEQRQPAVATRPTDSPAQVRPDTPPAGAAKPAEQAAGEDGPNVSQADYEGWRQYSVNCARCHGQDVLPNPVAANLLISLGSGGPISSEEEFFEVVNEGRPARGMPGFKGVLSREQIEATYAYVKGRAEKRIPPGRPARPPA